MISCKAVSVCEHHQFDDICEVCTSNKNDVDNINHPKHYNSLGAKCECGRMIECIQVTSQMDFLAGNVIKYVWRSKHKNGVEDLKKAKWYLDFLVNNLENENERSE